MYRNRRLGFRQVPIRPVYNYRLPEDLDSSSTSPKTNVCHYFHYRRENDYFHDDPVNNYFHFERVPP